MSFEATFEHTPVPAPLSQLRWTYKLLLKMIETEEERRIESYAIGGTDGVSSADRVDWAVCAGICVAVDPR